MSASNSSQAAGSLERLANDSQGTQVMPITNSERLTALPIEILHIVARLLPLESLVCLRNSTNYFKQLLTESTLKRILADLGPEPLSAFHNAALQGFTQCCILLLDTYSIPIDEQDPLQMDNATPLHRATRAGQHTTAKLLLQRGALPNSQDIAGETPMHLCATFERLSIIELLCLFGGRASFGITNNLGYTPLHIAVAAEDFKAVDKMIKQGCSIDQRGGVVAPTALHLSIQSRTYPMTEFLLERHAAVNLLDRMGRTPLHYAAISQDERGIRSLIEAGADVTIIDNYNSTVLHFLSEKVNYSHNPNYCIDVVLQAMSRALSPSAVLLLLNHQDSDSKTALHRAVEKPTIGNSMAEVLLRHGAASEIPDEYGRTPMHLATIGQNAQYVTLLFANGASINAQDEDGNTPLHYALWGGHETMCLILLDLGAEVTIENQIGETAVTAMVNNPPVSNEIWREIEARAKGNSGRD